MLLVRSDPKETDKLFNITDPDLFDAGFFNITDFEAKEMSNMVHLLTKDLLYIWKI